MAFVLERITTDAQRAELVSLRIGSPFSAVQAPYLDRWVVDRDRGIYFVSFGRGGPETPYAVALFERDGPVLQAEGTRESSGPYVPHGIEERWNLTSISIPRSQVARSNELMSALRDALHAYGSLGRPEFTRSVEVTLSPAKFV